MTKRERGAGTVSRAVACRTLGVLGVYAAYALAAARLPVSPPRAEASDLLAVPGAPSQESRSAWLAMGCQTCHSIYGLGGHTGPDLTDVTSRVPREYIEAVVRSGARGMPAFEVEDEKLARIIEYLASIDASGEYSPAGLEDGVFGER